MEKELGGRRMKITRAYGHGSAFIVRCRFFTMIVHLHHPKHWKKYSRRSKAEVQL